MYGGHFYAHSPAFGRVPLQECILTDYFRTPGNCSAKNFAGKRLALSQRGCPVVAAEPLAPRRTSTVPSAKACYHWQAGFGTSRGKRSESSWGRSRMPQFLRFVPNGDSRIRPLCELVRLYAGPEFTSTSGRSSRPPKCPRCRLWKGGRARFSLCRVEHMAHFPQVARKRRRGRGLSSSRNLKKDNYVSLKPQVADREAQRYPAARHWKQQPGLCLSRTNYNVELEHWLMKLVEAFRTQTSEFCSGSGMSMRRALTRDLTKVIDRLKTGNSRHSWQLAPHILDWAREAWLLASVDSGAAESPLGPPAAGPGQR